MIILMALLAFNSLILFWVSSIVAGLFFHIPGEYANFLLGGFSLLAVLGMAVLFNSSAGEWMLRLYSGARKTIPREDKKLNPIIERVQQAIEIKLSRKKIPVHLMVVDEPIPNAFAIGKSTIIVSRALYEKSTDEELAGVIAHEFGHLHNGDSNQLGIALGMSLVSMTISITAGFFAMLIGGLSNLSGSTKSDSGAAIAIFGFFTLFFVMFFTFFVRAGNWILNLAMLFIGRKQEHKADQFAIKAGFGAGLLSFLETIKDMEFEKPKTLFSRIYATHPATMLRIGEVEKSLPEQATT